jgi:hypothetical protein
LGINLKTVVVIPSFYSPTLREEEIAEIVPKRYGNFIDNHKPCNPGKGALR